MRSVGMRLILGMALSAIALMPLASQTAQEYRIGDVKITGNKIMNDAMIRLFLRLVPGQVERKRGQEGLR
jgi:hypothetical protein